MVTGEDTHSAKLFDNLFSSFINLLMQDFQICWN